jgi:uncharacterized surface protein with fasciclin (FAS1) repeats
MTDFDTSSHHWSFLFAGLLVLVLAGTGCDAFTDEDLGDSNPQSPTIVGYVSEVQAFSILEDAATRAGLVDDLESDGITLFAPKDGAFDPLDESDLMADANSDLLKEVLTYHVVPQRIKMREGDSALGAGATEQFETLEGDTVTVQVTEDNVTVNGVTVSNADADASNGVVHVTEGVLLEAVDAVDRAEVTSQFRVLRNLIEKTGLTETLRGPGPDASEGLTVFAPTNAALLGALDSNGNGEIDNSEIPSNASEILQYHVLDSVFFASDVPTSATDVPTLEGSNVTVQRSNGTVTVNGNEVAIPNAEVENGVIHGIDAVLMP